MLADFYRRGYRGRSPRPEGVGEGEPAAIQNPRWGGAGQDGFPNSWYALLDRDGTVIAERTYLADPAGVELLPGAAAAIRRLRALGIGVAIVSNQSGVGRGLITPAQLAAVNARMVEALAAAGAAVDGIYVCLHTPDAGCRCRKPLPGLAHQAAAELGFDLAKTIVVGDKPCDIDLGVAIGARTVLVRTGYGREFEGQESLAPDFVIDDLGHLGTVLDGIAADPPKVGV